MGAAELGPVGVFSRTRTGGQTQRMRKRLRGGVGVLCLTVGRRPGRGALKVQGVPQSMGSQVLGLPQGTGGCLGAAAPKPLCGPGTQCWGLGEVGVGGEVTAGALTLLRDVPQLQPGAPPHGLPSLYKRGIYPLIRPRKCILPIFVICELYVITEA